MYRLARALLFLLPAEVAHRLVMAALGLLGRARRVCQRMRARRLPVGPVDLSVEVAGLRFAHPVALAAGLDKDAEAVAALFGLGFSAVEVGTLTPRAQPGNPRPRLFRLPEVQGLINRMGFNNHGARPAAERLSRETWRPGPVGVNIGKNKDTPLERAVEDYLACVDVLAPSGDYVVINASSPNTPGLRQLQEPEQLRSLLGAVRERVQLVARGTPVFLKISPDLGATALEELVEVAVEGGLQGLIATNTTVGRPLSHELAGEVGGLSGAPLRALSTEVLRTVVRASRGRIPVIAAGGVFTLQDVLEKLRAGAALVQVYSGFVYEGPGMVSRLVAELAAFLAREGHPSLATWQASLQQGAAE